MRAFLQAVAVIGSGGSDDFIVTSQDWVNEPVPCPAGRLCKDGQVSRIFRAARYLTIDSAWWADQVHFKPATAATAIARYSVLIPVHSSALAGERGVLHRLFPGCQFDYESWIVLRDIGTVIACSRLTDGVLSPRFDSLVGNGVAPSETFVLSIDTTFDCWPATDTATATFTITATGTSNSYIEGSVIQSDPTDVFFNLSGTLVNGSNTVWNPKTQSQELTPGQTATISVQYTVQPDSTNATFVDHLTAINGDWRYDRRHGVIGYGSCGL